jgi:DNA-binding IscR family transcriptional regulator
MKIKDGEATTNKELVYLTFKRVSRLLTSKEISHLAGLEVPSVQACLGELKQAGVVRVMGGKIGQNYRYGLTEWLNER